MAEKNKNDVFRNASLASKIAFTGKTVTVLWLLYFAATSYLSSFDLRVAAKLTMLLMIWIWTIIFLMITIMYCSRPTSKEAIKWKQVLEEKKKAHL